MSALIASSRSRRWKPSHSRLRPSMKVSRTRSGSDKVSLYSVSSVFSRSMILCTIGMSISGTETIVSEASSSAFASRIASAMGPGALSSISSSSSSSSISSSLSTGTINRVIDSGRVRRRGGGVAGRGAPVTLNLKILARSRRSALSTLVYM